MYSTWVGGRWDDHEKARFSSRKRMMARLLNSIRVVS